MFSLFRHQLQPEELQCGLGYGKAHVRILAPHAGIGWQAPPGSAQQVLFRARFLMTVPGSGKVAGNALRTDILARLDAVHFQGKSRR